MTLNRLNLRTATAVVALVLVLAGCNKGPDLVGVWTTSITPMPGKEMDPLVVELMKQPSIETTFKGDGTWSQDDRAGTWKRTDSSLELVTLTYKGKSRAELDERTAKAGMTNDPGLKRQLDGIFSPTRLELQNGGSTMTDSSDKFMITWSRKP